MTNTNIEKIHVMLIEAECDKMLKEGEERDKRLKALIEQIKRDNGMA